MKILVLCSFGQNRSRIVAEHLRSRGYDADFDGVENDHDAVQAKIDAADTIVTVHPMVKEKLIADFDVSGKRIIGLDVDDRPQCALSSKKAFAGDDWHKFQAERVYPDLIAQVDKHF